MKRKIKGFTLIEILATVIILSIVLLIAVPVILNTIENTRKKAFINSVLAFSSSSSIYLDTEVIENRFKYPSKNKFKMFDISVLSLDNGDKYSGDIAILKDENSKIIHLPYITDTKYYVCGVATEVLTIKHIQTNECKMPQEGDTIITIDGIDTNNSIDSDDDGFPDIIEDKYNTNKNDNTSYPDINNDKGPIINNYEFSNNNSNENEDIVEEPVVIYYPNKPVLTEGMTPIVWDNDGNVKVTTEDDTSWYDYSKESKKWANAQTNDGSMWVWIPRYAYQITSGYHTNAVGTIEVKFLKDTTDVALDETSCEPVDQGNNPGSDTKFVVHPAFKFGDDELAGIWVMKFEASNNGGLIASIPNASSWADKTPSQMFDLSRKMETNTTYGWSNSGIGIDTHMMKDVEWGAASYLAWSEYGKNSEVWINNSSTLKTGCAGSTASAASFAGCQNAYNTTGGQKASTTGNYYGIYDMSGGAVDRTAAYLIGGGSNLSDFAGLLVKADSKYVDAYKGTSSNSQTNYNLNTKYYGNAIYETSSLATGNNSWFEDNSIFTNNAAVVSFRGGFATYGANAGIFAFNSTGGGASANHSWRSVLVVKEGI